MPLILQGPDLHTRFKALDTFLSAHQHLWRPRPFTHLYLPWENQHPQLATWLRQRSLDDAENSHNHPEQLAAPAPFPALAAESRALAAVCTLHA
ncbi:SAM-dependent methyltransferase, partial [Pseudomonas gingeri]|nr:SAM-dependent methyltransferase [Pseudomonas gingeri]